MKWRGAGGEATRRLRVAGFEASKKNAARRARRGAFSASSGLGGAYYKGKRRASHRAALKTAVQDRV